MQFTHKLFPVIQDYEQVGGIFGKILVSHLITQFFHNLPHTTLFTIHSCDEL